jgi:hypothetical protein
MFELDADSVDCVVTGILNGMHRGGLEEENVRCVADWRMDRLAFKVVYDVRMVFEHDENGGPNMRVHLLHGVRRVDDVENPYVLIFVDHFVKFRRDDSTVVCIGSDWGAGLRVRAKKERSGGTEQEGRYAKTGHCGFLRMAALRIARILAVRPKSFTKSMRLYPSATDKLACIDQSMRARLKQGDSRLVGVSKKSFPRPIWPSQNLPFARQGSPRWGGC